MAQLQALIFDVDGTLADTECEGHRVAFNRAFNEYGLSWNWSVELYGTLLAVGGGKERMKYFLETHHPSIPPSFSVEDIPALHLLKNKYYEEILLNGEIPLRPGVIRLFNEAQAQGIRMAIATTSSLTNTLALLKYHLGSEAESLFEVIGAGDVVPNKKPAPDIYQYVLEKLGVPPESCVVFEDSEAGVKASCHAHLATVMTINTYTESHSSKGAALVVDHLGDPNNLCKAIAGNIEGFQGQVDLEVCQKILNVN